MRESRKSKGHYNSGKHLSEATKLKISKAMSGKEPPFLGKHHSEKTRKKMSISQKIIIKSGINHPPIKIGSEHYNWKGGIVVNSAGYVLIWKPKHPYSNCRGYLKRSRLVMEQHLGRYLKPEETIHHKNGIKEDDRIENLTLFTSNADHARFHYHLKKLSIQADRLLGLYIDL